MGPKKSGRIIKPRVDPRVSWPCIQDFQARFCLPQECVEELTDKFECSPFRRGKGRHEKRRSPIPLELREDIVKNILPAIHFTTFLQVCYALRYMATGSYYAVIRDTQGGCVEG